MMHGGNLKLRPKCIGNNVWKIHSGTRSLYHNGVVLHLVLVLANKASYWIFIVWTVCDMHELEFHLKPKVGTPSLI